MISINVINKSAQKTNKIEGNVFHLFYMDASNAILFDRDLTLPLIWGTKTVVRSKLKDLDTLMNVPPTAVIQIHSYKFDDAHGYRWVGTFKGPIETIQKQLAFVK